MNTKNELKIILKYNENINILHIYNKLLAINTKLFKEYKLKLTDIRTINAKEIQQSCMKANYYSDDTELEIKINYYKENCDCLLENIIVKLVGDRTTNIDLINISDIIDSTFLN